MGDLADLPPRAPAPLLPFSIEKPEDLRQLSMDQLNGLAQQFREKIISVCLKNGGHLGGSLGAVELAIALHFVFESPIEPLIWDVGHQAYAHKLICGRSKNFDTLRTLGGISGFLRRQESSHDSFGAGHSSTSLSAALAFAWKKGRELGKGAHGSPPGGVPDAAPDLAKSSHSWTVAIIGDGGFSAGLAFEALNNLLSQPIGPLLVVLNDNQMSISKNVGTLSKVFQADSARVFFELFGFKYYYLPEGHDLEKLIHQLQSIRNSTSVGPVILHIRTQKGKGYLPAEQKPAAFHGINPVPSQNPVAFASKPSRPSELSKTYSQRLGEIFCEFAAKDDKIVVVCAAMADGTGMSPFANQFPDRFFDVGIAEAHAVTFAAALAAQGFKPFVAIYSTFLQRSLDSIIHDVALQNLGVTFVIDRAGSVGQDGPTHHGVFDLVYLGMIPQMTVTAPSCPDDLRGLIESSLQARSPWAIRYPRGSGLGKAGLEPWLTLDIPKGERLRWHQRASVPEVIAVGLGDFGLRLVQAVQQIDPNAFRISAVSVIQAKPFPKGLIDLLNQNPQASLITLEEGVTRGGFGQSLWAEIGSSKRRAPVLILGYPDRFLEHGSTSELEKVEGLSQELLIEKIQAFMVPK